MNKIAPIYWFVLSLLLTACSSAPLTKSAATGYEESGEASYYAAKYQGRQTASGERFNQNALTAAHKRLPFGSRVKVTNIANGKSVIVRINDRGPFVRGRIIDLSKSAFQRIGNTRHGVIDVEIRVLN
ncbi:septal ring lytic transglycosylase RlpA family protein [Marinomonas pollencensis]|uniref:Endolytic peptidoglycan transglycosylase RlpA n=1 Tax=Marinomonas pollencensis TaxID=491954 RepID=A0A3E0DIQ6_9GAMM|nr:septal ring lytic transglycosylase RlpA family protein [Marinomonas pollencensis]REG82600.1 rare lipoprotein A [Marinomonas pollencensis]